MFSNDSDSGGEDVDQPLAFDSEDDFLFASIDETPTTTPKSTFGGMRTLEMSDDSVTFENVVNNVRELNNEMGDRYDTGESGVISESVLQNVSNDFEDTIIEDSNLFSKNERGMGYADLMDQSSLMEDSRSLDTSTRDRSVDSGKTDSTFSFGDSQFMTVGESEDQTDYDQGKFSEEFEDDEDASQESEEEEEEKDEDNDDGEKERSSFPGISIDSSQRNEVLMTSIINDPRNRDEVITTITTTDDDGIKKSHPPYPNEVDEDPLERSSFIEGGGEEEEEEEETRSDEPKNEIHEHQLQQQQQDDDDIGLKKEKEEEEDDDDDDNNEPELLSNIFPLLENKEGEDNNNELEEQEEEEHLQNDSSIIVKEEEEEEEIEIIEKREKIPISESSVVSKEEEEEEEEEEMEIERVTIDPHNISILKTKEIPKKREYNVYTRDLILEQQEIIDDDEYDDEYDDYDETTKKNLDFLLNDRNFLLNEEIESKFLHSDVFLSVVLGMTIQDILNNPFQSSGKRNIRQKTKRKKKRKNIRKRRGRGRRRRGRGRGRRGKRKKIMNDTLDLVVDDGKIPKIIEMPQEEESEEEEKEEKEKRMLSPSLRMMISKNTKLQQQQQQQKEISKDNNNEDNSLINNTLLNFEEKGSLKETIGPYLNHFLFSPECSGEIIQEKERTVNLKHLKLLILLDLSRILSRIGNHVSNYSGRRRRNNNNKKKKNEKKISDGDGDDDDDDDMFLRKIIVNILPNELKEHLISTFISNLFQALPFHPISGLPSTTTTTTTSSTTTTTNDNNNEVIRNFRFRRRYNLKGVVIDQQQQKTTTTKNEGRIGKGGKGGPLTMIFVKKYKFDYWVRTSHLFELMDCISETVFRRLLGGFNDISSVGSGKNLNIQFFNFEEEKN